MLIKRANMDLPEFSTAPNNVLLIEDNNDDRSTIRLHLELMGFVVYDTPSPIEAREIFDQHD